MKTVWSFLKDMWVEWGRIDIYRLAASLVITSTLSLIPLLTAFLGFGEMLGLFHKAIEKAEPLIYQYIAPGTSSEFVANLQASVSRNRGSVVGVVGFVLLLWTVTRLLMEIDQAFHSVAGDRCVRQSKRRFVFLWLAILLGPIVIGVMTFLTEYWNLQSILPDIGIWLTGFLILFGMFRFAYSKAIPTKYVLLITTVCATGVILSERIYVWASKTLFDYNEIYGSLAFLPLFLFWLLVFWNVILLSILFGRVLIQKKLGSSLHSQRPAT